MGAGSRFVRADLHVHTRLAPGEKAPSSPPSVATVVAAAAKAGISVLAITDHNTAANVREALSLATDELLILPGIEISTSDGHVLGLFDPDSVDSLEDLARPEMLQLRTIAADGTQRSQKSMTEIVREIGRRGGLAIAAHIDASDSLLARANHAALADLLSQPALTGLEVTNVASLSVFTVDDSDGARRQVWIDRVKSLGADAPLARIMSSDAHSPEEVGADRSHRTLTRLRLDDLNFSGVRAALRSYPDARCKVEANLAAHYPRLLSAHFDGGFLNGLTLEFSPNLNCFIGGRGSGKSTCLSAIQGVLAGSFDVTADAHPNMPDYTEVVFIDGLGSRRRAGRKRGKLTMDLDAPPALLSLPFIELEQNFGAEILFDDPSDPRETHEFLTRTLGLAEEDASEVDLLTRLSENGDTLKRTAVATGKLKALRERRTTLDRTLTTATDADLTKVAEYARILAAEGPLIEEVGRRLLELPDAKLPETPSISKLASRFGVDVTHLPAAKYVPSLEVALIELEAKVRANESDAQAQMTSWASPAAKILDQWKAQHTSWERQITLRKVKLQAAGLTLQVEQLERIRREIKASDIEIRKFEEWEAVYKEARALRKELLSKLKQVYDRRHAERQRLADELSKSHNAGTSGAAVSIKWVKGGMRSAFAERLGQIFEMRSPRKERLAAATSPEDLAAIGWAGDADRLRRIGGSDPFFPDPGPALEKLRTFDQIFEFELMDLEDRPEIAVRFAGDPPGPRRPVRELSLGQLRSVLLGLILSAKGNALLILDQPEDQLDGPFIAEHVVGYLHAAKERRQLIIATHNPNLVVLGDAELVYPLVVDKGQASVLHAGSVDAKGTNQDIVLLLEGGLLAFRRRGDRYGLTVEQRTAS